MAGGSTIVVTRRVRAGHEAAYEAWIAEIQAASRAFPGYQGVDVARPASPTQPYTIVVRFDSPAAREAWEAWETRRAWLERVPSAAVEGDAEVRYAEGVEFWFEAPPSAPPVQPSKHRMAVVLLVVVFALVSVLGPLARWALDGWPAPVIALVMVACQVSLMTYVVMPRVTRWLAPFLFPAR
jgi:antibiotic biosynthesis monooxygenase (ABM) superfamily enzyme